MLTESLPGNEQPGGTGPKSPARPRSDKAAVFKTLDANEAAAYVAYQLNEVMAIYPITPSSPIAEWCDQWASEGKTKSLGNCSGNPGNAKRGRSGRGGAWRIADRHSEHDVYRVASSPADDSEHVQDCGRTAARRLSRHCANSGNTRAFNFRRSAGKCDPSFTLLVFIMAPCLSRSLRIYRDQILNETMAGI